MIRRAWALKGERPEKILVINVGSSSLKYSFYDTANESREAKGIVERIPDGTRLSIGAEGRTGATWQKRSRGCVQGQWRNYFEGNRVISSAAEVSVVAHRIVHGGEKFTKRH